MNLRYQVTIGGTARECRMEGGLVSIKVGMEGRVILGPEGSAGSVDVPLRFSNLMMLHPAAFSAATCNSKS